MILKNYISFMKDKSLQFINESFNEIDFNDDELMYDLRDAGIYVNDEGELYLSPDRYGDIKVTINDGLVSRGKLYIDLSDLNNSKTYLDISEMPLDTLQGMPREVGSFKAYNNSFRTLEGGPIEVTESYMVYNNKKLKSLYGAPHNAWLLEIVNTGLTDCRGAEQGDYTLIILARNAELTSLQGLPEHVEEGIEINNCFKLESLAGMPTVIRGGKIDVKNCPIKTLYHIGYIESETLKIENTKVPSVEYEFFKNSEISDRKENKYFENLFIFAKNNKPKELELIQFPEEFINELSEEDKTLLRSSKGLAKYDL
jgi:hypothetical protein